MPIRPYCTRRLGRHVGQAPRDVGCRVGGGGRLCEVTLRLRLEQLQTVTAAEPVGLTALLQTQRGILRHLHAAHLVRYSYCARRADCRVIVNVRLHGQSVLR